MSDEDYRPPYRLIYVGLAFAAVAQVLIVWFNIDHGEAYTAPGNVVAFIFCLGTAWLIRRRQKGRL